MKVALGSDHGGFDLKESVKRALAARGVTVDDLGCSSRDAVDYPDYAGAVAERVSRGTVDQGILVCTAGIGMSIAANRFAHVRAALCLSPYMAKMARTHNDANVLVLAGATVSEPDAARILDAWLEHRFDGGAERHVRRLRKIERYSLRHAETDPVLREDAEVFAAIDAEIAREQETIDLIASENYASPAVRFAQASVLTNKYAEGYPGRRWYNGCATVDAVEQLAIDRARRLFGAEHANVQPHCGSSANMAVYFSALQPGDTILAMDLAHGGHLTHGAPVNFSGRLFQIASYGVDRSTGQIDFAEVARRAESHRPKLIVAGASAYPRTLDFARFREIADSVGARLMVDMAHIAGLVAGGAHPSPVPHADYVSTTTHKTLRGPRSGMVLCRASLAADLDRQVFPGLQGGPLMHTIAAKAVCFHEAARPEFRIYAAQVVRNARALADSLHSSGFRLVSGGTDNHLMLVDLSDCGLTGKDAAAALERAGIVVNKNVIPFDTRSPFVTSGIRIGTPAMTTRGMRENEARQVAKWIAAVLRNAGDEALIESTRAGVREMAAQFPVD